MINLPHDLGSAGLGAFAILILMAPLCAAIMALIRIRRDQPNLHRSTIRILGRMFIMTACGMAVLGAAGALLRGEQPIWPYVVMTGLPAIAVTRILYLYSLSPESPSSSA